MAFASSPSKQVDNSAPSTAKASGTGTNHLANSTDSMNMRQGNYLNNSGDKITMSPIVPSSPSQKKQSLLLTAGNEDSAYRTSNDQGITAANNPKLI